ncbi:DUF6082 family protein [Streptomyces sp. NPDC002734]|uniref:DUF6082 family protein n=1 Tax=Streptomyces sp. NPDC002734 TaxID=3154426 RepID=UPI003319BDF4
MATQFLRSLAVACLGAAAGAITATAVQRRALDELRAALDQHLTQTRAMRREVNLTSQQRQHWALLSKAIDDPDLAEVLDVYEGPGLTPRKRRQYLFANALYTNMLFYYRIGNMTKEEFFGFARSTLQNAPFREYWHDTRHHRVSLPPSTEEAQLGALIDGLLQELEQAEDEDWWVVGIQPSESEDEH